MPQINYQIWKMLSSFSGLYLCANEKNLLKYLVYFNYNQQLKGIVEFCSHTSLNLGYTESFVEGHSFCYT